MAVFIIMHFELKMIYLLEYPKFRPIEMISIIPRKARKSQCEVSEAINTYNIKIYIRFYIFIYLFDGRPIIISIYKK